MPGLWQHFTDVDQGIQRGHAFEEGESGSTAPASADSSRFRKATCCSFRIRRPRSSIRSPPRRTTLVLICNVKDPDHRRVVFARPALHRAEGRGVPEVDRHRRHRLLRARAGVLHPRRRALRPGLQPRLLLHRREVKASGTPAARRTPTPRATRATSATSRATRKATSPCRPWTATRTCARR